VHFNNEKFQFDLFQRFQNPVHIFDIGLFKFKIAKILYRSYLMAAAAAAGGMLIKLFFPHHWRPGLIRESA